MINGLAICSGIGGLELGLKLALGESYTTVGYVEREAYCNAVLRARMEEELLDTAPIWDEVEFFCGKKWRGVVDLISAGFPCQPHSLAGKRKGEKDERWIWPDIARIIREIRPSLIFLENVPGLFISGFERVLGDLAESGFNAEWDVFSAAGVGSPHIRRRLFVLAWRERDTLRLIAERRASAAARGEEPDGRRDDMADTPNNNGRCGVSGEKKATRKRGIGRQRSPSRSTEMADCSGGRCEGERVEKPRGLESASRDEPIGCCDNGKLRIWPPGPNGDWEGVPPGLKPAICRVADGAAYRLDRLRCLGNAVLPIVAAKAFVTLTGRILNGK